MENQEKIVESPNSCEISINAKGQYSGKVKAYAATLFEACNEATERARELERLIRAKNGMGEVKDND